MRVDTSVSKVVGAAKNQLMRRFYVSQAQKRVAQWTFQYACQCAVKAVPAKVRVAPFLDVARCDMTIAVGVQLSSAFKPVEISLLPMSVSSS